MNRLSPVIVQISKREIGSSHYLICDARNLFSRIFVSQFSSQTLFVATLQATDLCNPLKPEVFSVKFTQKSKKKLMKFIVEKYLF